MQLQSAAAVEWTCLSLSLHRWRYIIYWSSQEVLSDHQEYWKCVRTQNEATGLLILNTVRAIGLCYTKSSSGHISDHLRTRLDNCLIWQKTFCIQESQNGRTSWMCWKVLGACPLLIVSQSWKYCRHAGCKVAKTLWTIADWCVTPVNVNIPCRSASCPPFIIIKEFFI